MLTYTELKKNPSKFLSLTSLEVKGFDALLPSFKQAWDTDVAKRINSKPRQRKPGGGRKATLKSLEDKLLFILVYIKVYPLQEVQGTLFGISQGQANGWSQRLTPLLQSTMAQEDLLSERATFTSRVRAALAVRLARLPLTPKVMLLPAPRLVMMMPAVTTAQAHNPGLRVVSL